MDAMTQAWHLQPDGTYKRLSDTEDIMTDLISTFEDVNEMYRRFREVALESLAIRQQSRLLIEQTRRERRLRKTSLRLVRVLA